MTKKTKTPNHHKKKLSLKAEQEIEALEKEIKHSHIVKNHNNECDFLTKVNQYNVEIKFANDMMILYYPKIGKSIAFLCDQKTLSSYKLYRLKKLVGEIDD